MGCVVTYCILRSQQTQSTVHSQRVSHESDDDSSIATFQQAEMIFDS